jgi:Family of unknown function (DUF5338)
MRLPRARTAMTAQKSLSQRIAEDEPPRSRRHTSTILALRADIESCLHDGWTRRSIWRRLHKEGAVTIGYQAFIEYLKRTHITPAAVTPEAPPTQTTPPSPRGFHHSPRPNKDHLA